MEAWEGGGMIDLVQGLGVAMRVLVAVRVVVVAVHSRGCHRGHVVALFVILCVCASVCLCVCV